MSVPHFEQLSGVIDGINLVFTASVPYTAGSTAVFLNGQLILNLFAPGLPWAESDSGSGEITFVGSIYTPQPGDVVQMFFLDMVPVVLVAADLEGALDDMVIMVGEIDDQDDLTGVVEDCS